MSDTVPNYITLNPGKKSMQKMYTVDEFADAIRKKHPGAYDNKENDILVDAVIKKYPVYNKQIERKNLETGLMTSQQNLIDKQKAFEQTKLGKFLDRTEKTIGFLPSIFGITDSFKPTSEIMRDRFLRKNELDELPPAARLMEEAKDVAKAGIRRAAKVAPNLVPVGRGAKLASGAGSFLKSAAKEVATLSGAVGASKVVEKLAEGEDLESSVKKGGQDALFTAGVGGTLQIGLPAARKIIKEIGKFGLATSSKVKAYAVREAIKNPKVLFEEQPSILQMNDKIKKSLDDYSGKVKEAYGEKIERLTTTKQVKLTEVGKITEIASKQTNVVKDTLKNANKAQLANLSDDFIDDLIDGKIKTMSFEDSKRLNRVLDYVTSNKGTDKLGTGAIKIYTDLKTALKNNQEAVVPGLRQINKKYAQRLEKYKDLKKVVDSNGFEGTLTGMGEQLAGVNRKHSSKLRLLKNLDKATGRNLSKELKDSVVSREFDQQGVGDLMDLIFSIGSFELLSGGFTGKGAALATAQWIARSPKMTERAIKAGSKLGEKTRPLQDNQTANLLYNLGVRGATLYPTRD